MKGLTSLWGRQPAMILAVVQAALALLLSFGVGLSTEQIGAILAVTAAVLGFLTQSQVTPVANPNLPGFTITKTEPDAAAASAPAASGRNV